MLTLHQLRDSLRKGLFLTFKAEHPTASNAAALRYAQMEEKRAWKRRDYQVVVSLLSRVGDDDLKRLEQRFQEYFKPRQRLADNLAERSRRAEAVN
jgi:hypothetical protein